MYEIGDLILKHYTSNSFADNARKNNIVITYYYTNSNILTDEKNTTNKYNIFKNLNNIHSELTKSIAEQPPKNANDKPNITNDALRILKNITLSLDKSNNDNEYIKISLKPIDIII
jgi:thiamine kinase-like enzyme